MANSLYDHGRNEFLNGNIDWVNDAKLVLLVDTADYTVNLSSHQDRDDVGATATVASASLSGESASAGTADAADTTVSSVSGDQFEALIISLDTGNTANDTLIAYIDTATGLPTTPNGADINIVWDSGSDKIFTLSSVHAILVALLLEAQAERPEYAVAALGIMALALCFGKNARREGGGVLELPSHERSAA